MTTFVMQQPRPIPTDTNPQIPSPGAARRDPMTIQQGLELAAEKARGAPVRYEGFFSVAAPFRGETLWQVSIFDSDQGRVYAWTVNGAKEPEFIAMPEHPPILTPHAAVRAWIATQESR